MLPHAARVGFVGLGRMGRPMAQRLGAAGYALTVFDAQRQLATAFAAEHAVAAAGSLEELGRTCDAVITMLPDGAAVAAVVAGDGADASDCLLAGADEGTVLVDMGSSEPAGTRMLSARAAERGVVLCDAPVSGGVPKAVTGALTILVGGPGEVVERCRPLLSHLGTQIFATGPVGSGHALKALNNLLSAAGLLATAEVLLIGARFGLDPSLMLEVLNASTGRNNSTERKIGPYVLTGSYDSGFALELMVKDLRTALGIAEHTGTAAPLSDAVLRLCAAAREALAPGADHTEVARWVQDLAGFRYDDRSSR